MHLLNFRVEDGLDLTTFTVKDTSSYDGLIPISTPVLEIKTPGSVNPIIFSPIIQGFTKVVNSNNLHLNSNNFKYLALPDGAYTIRYSVAPNIKTFIEYYYFRNSKQQNLYYNTLVKFLQKRSILSNKFFSEGKKELIWIKEMMIGSKFLAEDCQDIKGANDMYKEIISQLTKFKYCD